MSVSEEMGWEMLMASQGTAAWCCAASPVGELDQLNIVHLVVLAQSKRKDVRRKTNMEKCRSGRNKTRKHLF